MNNDMNDKDIENVLKNIKVPEGMLDKENFWKEFKEKASEIEQEPAAKPALHFPGWLKAVAGIVIVSSVWLSVWFFSSNNIKDETMTASIIEDYEIYSEHSGVFILQDENNSGTVLWISGMKDNSGG